MKTTHFFHIFAAFLVAGSARMGAAPITWDIVYNVTGPSDVSTNGTLVEACNLSFRSITSEGVTPDDETVNVVTFTLAVAPENLSGESGGRIRQLSGNDTGDASYGSFAGAGEAHFQTLKALLALSPSEGASVSHQKLGSGSS